MEKWKLNPQEYMSSLNSEEKDMGWEVQVIQIKTRFNQMSKEEVTKTGSATETTRN